MTNFDSESEYSEEFFADLMIFVGENSDYYMRKWYVMVIQKKVFSWNWAAFLFPWAWLAYRKMYFLSILFLGLTTLVEFLVPTFSTISLLVLAIACGSFGNYIYYYKTVRKITLIQLTVIDPKLKGVELIRQGGTSWLAVMVVMILIAFGTALFPAPQNESPGFFDSII